MSRFSKTGWILYEKVGGGVDFFLIYGGTTGWQGVKGGSSSPPEFYWKNIYYGNKTKWIWIYDRERRRYSAIEDHKMPFKTIKRPCKSIQDHTRSHKEMLNRMRPQMAIAIKSNKPIRDHTRQYKATLSHTGIANTRNLRR